ncbi:MAG: universal stress protein, partial [Candidatus Bathyarchaeia archaeon]
HVVARIVYAFAETYGLAALSSKEMEEEGSKILTRAQEFVKSQQLDVSIRILHGNPAEEIIKESENVNLIVIGCRGLTGAKAFFLGSVSSRVSRYARCPVLIVK